MFIIIDTSKKSIYSKSLQRIKNNLKINNNSIYKNLKISKPIEFIKSDPEHVLDGFRFDANNNLQEVDLIDEKSGLNVAHIESKTPTPGDTFGVVEQIFSNLKRRQATE